jgi:hypothetical protein
VKNDDVAEVLHMLPVTVIDHIPDLVAHANHALDREINVEDIVGLGRVRDEEEVEVVLETEEGGVVVYVEEVVVEVDIGTSPSFYARNYCLIALKA